MKNDSFQGVPRDAAGFPLQPGEEGFRSYWDVHRIRREADHRLEAQWYSVREVILGVAI